MACFPFPHAAPYHAKQGAKSAKTVLLVYDNSQEEKNPTPYPTPENVRFYWCFLCLV